VANHGVAVTFEPLARKGRRCKATLSVPEVPFAREQTSPEDCGNMPPEEGVLLEPLMVLDENGFEIARAA
jgi:hypothetical protein